MKQQIYAACPHDCPDACGVQITVEDGRATKLQGDARHPVTRGFLCAKVTKYLDRVYSPGRLLYPMRRKKNVAKGAGAKNEEDFERISWDAALDEIYERLSSLSRELGPEAILPYSYGGTLGVRVQEYPPEKVAQWTGIAASDIRKLAHEYVSQRPAAIRVNYGVQRSENGGSAMRAIAMLPCITGSWKELGGGLQLSTSGGWQLNNAALTRPDLM